MSFKKNRPTIWQLEKATGFSRGTISRAFNNHPNINAETKELVLRKAEEIGYTPHPGARTIKLGKTHRWGLLIPHLRNPFHGDLIESLDREARLRNTVLFVGISHYDRKLESQLMRHWMSGETDGLIFASVVSKIEPEILAQLRARNFPVVFLYEQPAPDFDMTAADSIPAFERAMDHLYSLGHRTIAYTGPAGPNRLRTSVCIAYRKKLAQWGISLDENLTYFGSEDSGGAEAWRKWRNLPKRPTAVICFNDITAFWLIRAVELDGLSIPRDLSVIGGDDIAEAARHGLTTVRTNPSLIAQSVFTLLDSPKKKQEPGRIQIVPSELILRDTSTAPAGKKALKAVD